MPLITPLTNKTSSLTTGNAWHTVNCSELPGTATGVILMIRNVAGAGAYFPKVRRDAAAEPTTAVAIRLPGYITLPVPLTASRTFDFYADGPVANYEIYISYYFESEATWFTTPVEKTQTAGGTWQRISFASEIGGGTALALLGYADAYSGGNLRMVGSTDDRMPGEFSNDSLGMILGLSSNKEIEYRVPYTNSSKITAFGYLTSGFTPSVNATDVTPATVGSYADIGPLASGATAALIEVDLVSPGDSYYIRRKDNTEDFFGPQRAPLSHNFVGLNSGRQAEAKYAVAGTKFFLMGIFGSGVAPPPTPSLASGPASCADGDTGLTFSGNNLGATINDRVVSVRANYGSGIVNVVQSQTSGDANGGAFAFTLGNLRPGPATLRVLVGSTPLERPITITAAPGRTYFTVGTPKADVTKRTETTNGGDIVSGDMGEISSIVGAGTVEHTAGGSLRASSAVQSNVYRYHNGLLWGSGAVVTWQSPVSAPTPPSGLTATALSETGVALSWNAASDNSGSGIRGYRVRRNGVQIVGEATQTGLTFNDSGLSAWTQYSYTVAAVDNNGGVSTFTAAATVRTTDATPPAAVSGVTITNEGPLTLRLSWPAATDTGSGVALYRVDVNNGTPVEVTTTEYRPPGLAYGVPYTFGVRAVDSAGNVSARTASQTVTLIDDSTAPTESSVDRITLTRRPPQSSIREQNVVRYTGKCLDVNGAPVVPVSLHYIVRNLTEAATEIPATSITAAAAFEFEIPAQNVRISDDRNRSERYEVTVLANKDTADQVVMVDSFAVTNLSFAR